jgi:hypothetical protein
LTHLTTSTGLGCLGGRAVVGNPQRARSC